MHARRSRVKPCRLPQSSRRDVACLIGMSGMSGMSGEQIIRGYLQ